MIEQPLIANDVEMKVPRIFFARDNSFENEPCYYQTSVGIFRHSPRIITKNKKKMLICYENMFFPREKKGILSVSREKA